MPTSVDFSLVAQMVKNLPKRWETQVYSLGWEDPLEKGMVTHSSILPGEFHGQRRLVGYSPWGRKKSDTTERNTFHFKIIYKAPGILQEGELFWRRTIVGFCPAC